MREDGAIGKITILHKVKDTGVVFAECRMQCDTPNGDCVEPYSAFLFPSLFTRCGVVFRVLFLFHL